MSILLVAITTITIHSPMQRALDRGGSRGLPNGSGVRALTKDHQRWHLRTRHTLLQVNALKSGDLALQVEDPIRERCLDMLEELQHHVLSPDRWQATISWHLRTRGSRRVHPKESIVPMVSTVVQLE